MKKMNATKNMDSNMLELLNRERNPQTHTRKAASP